MSKELLAATFELKRFQMMETFKRNPGSISAPLVYAYDKHLAPTEHNRIAIEAYGFDPFDEIYRVNNDSMRAISDYLDKLWREANFEDLEFRELETAFSGHKFGRMGLAYAIRYFFLNGLFDAEFFKAVMKNAPIEASSIMDEYKPEDVFLD